MSSQPAGPHRTRIKVRGYHLDVYGHVNNARYLEFLEEARWALFEERTDLGRILGDGPAMVVVSLTINYRHPASIGDELEVRTSLGRIGGRSAVVHQEVVLAADDTPVADADITFVMVDRATGRALPLQDDLLSMLRQLA